MERRKLILFWNRISLTDVLFSPIYAMDFLMSSYLLACEKLLSYFKPKKIKATADKSTQMTTNITKHIIYRTKSDRCMFCGSVDDDINEISSAPRP